MKNENQKTNGTNQDQPPRKPEDFFHIGIEMLSDRQVFPFQMYVFNPMNNQYSLFLHGNNPLIKDKFQLLNYIIERGGGLAVRIDQKNTFLTSLDLKADDVPSLSKNKGLKGSVLDLVKAQKMAATALNEKNAAGQFKFQETLLSSILEDNFTSLIDQARDEISAFKITISPTVSLARFLALELLYEDNFTNQVVALSYHLTKTLGVVDQATLANMVCASFLYHLGETQVELEILKRPALENRDEQRKAYRQHPGLAQHLLKKINLELDPRCLSIILDHHERVDGSGYPNSKKNNHIDPLALCLGAVSHLMEFHQGKINGTKTPLKNIILNIKNKAPVSGLEFQFGDLLHQNLVHLINLESLKKLEEAKERERANQTKAA